MSNNTNSPIVPSSIITYRKLLSSCDASAKKITAAYSNDISCKKGCSECCILTSVFPIEAYNILLHLPEKGVPLSGNQKGFCHFLNDDACTIYEARPVICRTHGYPIWVEGKIDFCPKNFKQTTTIESEFILSLDAINTALATINKMFINELSFFSYSEDKRIPMKDISNFLNQLP